MWTWIIFRTVFQPLLRQVAQVARPVVAVVGEGEEEDGLGGGGHGFILG